MPCRVSKAEFGQHVEAALSELPERFRNFLDEVPIEIRDRPTARQLHDAGVDRNGLLLGLYVGTSLAHQSVMHGMEYPAVIYLFQEHIELICRSPDDLKREIRKTLLHEIGHHFGLDEDDLDRLGYG